MSSIQRGIDIDWWEQACSRRDHRLRERARSHFARIQPVCERSGIDQYC